MNRLSLKWISLTTVTALLAAGCATGAPQRRPIPNAGQGATGSSTAGSMDACAVALGNVGGTEITANGILLGNVALVGLPTTDRMPTTPGGTLSPTGDLPERGTLSPTGVTPGATTPAPVGTGIDQTGTPSGVAGGPPGNVTAVPPARAPGMMTTPMTPGSDRGAVDQVRTACPKVVQVRVVTENTDRARLAAIAQEMRNGQPITTYLGEISQINERATTAEAGANQAQQPGQAGAPLPALPIPAVPLPDIPVPAAPNIPVPAAPDLPVPAVPPVPTTPVSP